MPMHYFLFLGVALKKEKHNVLCSKYWRYDCFWHLTPNSTNLH